MSVLIDTSRPALIQVTTTATEAEVIELQFFLPDGSPAATVAIGARNAAMLGVALSRAAAFYGTGG